MEEIFTRIYENNEWGTNHNNEYNGSSGDGSDIEYNKIYYIPFLQQFIVNNHIKSIVDLGCGDFRCGPLIYDNLDISYNGYDIYKKLIDYNKKQNKNIDKYKFNYLDFFKEIEKIESGDLCILKDVLQHWELESIYIFLDKMVLLKKFKYILIINCGYQTIDNTTIQCGQWRPLSYKYYPLKKYHPILMGYYHSKEISLIPLSLLTHQQI